MIHEAVTSREAKGVVLNSKEEYNRCLVPTLTTTGTEMRKDPPKRKAARGGEPGDQVETRRKREGGEAQGRRACRAIKRRRTESPERV